MHTETQKDSNVLLQQKAPEHFHLFAALDYMVFSKVPGSG